ncbi:MAG: site-2 protease family protein [Hyphomicrobiales bacterium]|nr:site-2 protease family protein [Hyphomicrobiales bacterium]
MLTLLSALKFGKIAATSATMLLSIAVYAGAFGWRYAAGFVALLLIHELGHFFAARRRGLSVGAPIFIPFVGAYIALKEQPHDVETEAYVAIAGPVVGSFGAFIMYALARSENNDLLLAVSYAGFFLNLFNLLPISPLDGGRITAIISPRIWLLGAPLMGAAFFFYPSPIFIVIAFAAVPKLRQAWHYDPRAPANVAYFGVPTQTRVEYTLLYLMLILVLAAMTYSVHGMLGGLR